jgi:glycosyltransferase involved in cell wall biosynthesis
MKQELVRHTMLNQKNVLVIVPAFNEEESVGEVLADLQSLGYQVLVISDGSSDNTANIARDQKCFVLELPINLGVGGALRAGFKFAVRRNYQAVVQIDADGQHPVDEIKNLIDASNITGAHMVIGSRFTSTESTLKVSGVRRIAMRMLSRSASNAAKTSITDSTSGFRLIREPLLKEFSAQFANNYLGDTYESVISAGRGSFQITEVPAGLKPREIGESTASTGSAFKFTLKGLGVAFLRLHKRISLR